MLSLSKATYSFFFCLLSLLVAASACTSDEPWVEEDRTIGTGEAAIRLTIPMSGAATRSADASSSPRTFSTESGNAPASAESGNTRTGSSESDATTEEGKIKNLWFFAFPTGSEVTCDGYTFKGERVAKQLITSELNSTEYKDFTLTLKLGAYRMYVVANCDALYPTISENELKSIVLKYTDADGNIILPTPSKGLTMICMPTEIKNVDGNAYDATNGEIKIEKRETYTLKADLTFTCVKIRYTLLFDNASISQTNFTNLGLKIKSVRAKQIASHTSLTTPTTTATESCITLHETILTGLYHNYPSTDSNDLTDAGNPDLSETNRWAYQNIVYLPEHYVAEANKSEQTVLEIKAQIYNTTSIPHTETTTEVTYTLPLGGESGTIDATELRQMPRGTYYDIRANIVDRKNTTIEAALSITPWTLQALDIDLSHTELWVSKTKGSVSSFAMDSIYYDTNADDIEFICEDKVNDTDLIILSELDKERKLVRFMINANIGIDQFGTGAGQTPAKGTAHVAVKVNNHLQKYLDVEYDVTALLEVKPINIVINYDETVAINNQKVVNFRTNLGGIRLHTEENTNDNINLNLNATDNKSSLQVTSNNADKANGSLTITAHGNPGTTMVYYFTVVPRAQSYRDEYSRQVKVTVVPPVGMYKIYFTAINDDNDTGIEYYNSTFKYNTAQENSFSSWGTSDTGIYIYTQYGETAEGVTGSKSKVWRFSKNYGNEPMQADANNPGWNYFDLDPDLSKGFVSNPKSDGNYTEDKSFTKSPKPGETLIMFMKLSTKSTTYTPHRYPFNDEPGVPLFGFKDRIGWFVYDPTIEAYEFFDDKPEIELVTYTVYTRDAGLQEWYRNYGLFQHNSAPGKKDLTLLQKNLTPTASGSGWYKTTITLQAIKGRYAKSITLKKNDISIGELFGGADYSKYGNVGYYDGSSWHPGAPAGI